MRLALGAYGVGMICVGRRLSVFWGRYEFSELAYLAWGCVGCFRCTTLLNILTADKIERVIDI